MGGRDLGLRVGGISTLRAISMLAADPATEQIAVVSKPPAPAVATTILAALEAARKPSVACFVGAEHNVRYTSTLEAGANALLGRTHPEPDPQPAETQGRRGTAIRGLFAGGTLCAEAQAVLLETGLNLHSNAPIPGLANRADATHRLLDLGADEFTRGRPHPMIEPAVRTAHLRDAFNDPGVGVVLIDLVLGFGSSPDPATPIADALEAAPAERPAVIAYVCGIDGDPQGYRAQRDILHRAGVFLAPSNAAAARMAARLVS